MERYYPGAPAVPARRGNEGTGHQVQGESGLLIVEG